MIISIKFNIEIGVANLLLIGDYILLQYNIFISLSLY